MFIVAGHKKVRTIAGLAADYCPICRDFRAFEVTTVKNVPHLYYVPVAPGAVLAHEIECIACRSLFGVHDPAYAAYSRTFVADLADLARLTNPDVVSRNRLRVELADRLGRGQLSEPERRAMLREPFEALDYMVQKRWGAGSIPTFAGLAIIAAVFLIPISALSWSAGQGNQGTAAALAGLAAVFVVAALLSLRRGPRQWIRRHVHPRLAAALIPLSPSREELAWALDQMKEARRTIGRRIRLDDLAEDLDRACRASGL